MAKKPNSNTAPQQKKKPVAKKQKKQRQESGGINFEILSICLIALSIYLIICI